MKKSSQKNFGDFMKEQHSLVSDIVEKEKDYSNLSEAENMKLAQVFISLGETLDRLFELS